MKKWLTMHKDNFMLINKIRIKRILFIENYDMIYEGEHIFLFELKFLRII